MSFRLFRVVVVLQTPPFSTADYDAQPTAKPVVPRLPSSTLEPLQPFETVSTFFHVLRIDLPNAQDIFTDGVERQLLLNTDDSTIQMHASE